MLKPKGRRPLYVAPPEPQFKRRVPVALKEIDIDPLMKEFAAILSEPMSAEEMKGLGQPAYREAVVGLYKIYRHFKKQA